jgi:hypothetical protein
MRGAQTVGSCLSTHQNQWHPFQPSTHGGFSRRSDPARFPLPPWPLPRATASGLRSKPVWAHLQRQSLDELIAERFAPVAPSEARRVLSGRPLGFCRLRLLPKRTGMRPIANLKRASFVRFRAARAGAAGDATAAAAGLPAAPRAQGRGAGGAQPPPRGGASGARPRGAPMVAGGGGAGGKRGRSGHGPPLTLSFRPVNQVLQPTFQASGSAPSSPAGVFQSGPSWSWCG